MPGEAGGLPFVTSRIDGIPLYLIPKVIADQIREKRESVFKISVERRFNHRYSVIVLSRDEQKDPVMQQEPVGPKSGEHHG